MIPGAHNRVIIYGSLADELAADEEFQFGWADISTQSPAALAQLVDTAVKAAWGSTTTYVLGIMQNAKYLGTRVEAIDDTGKVVNSFNQITATPIAGPATANTTNILCQAVTLETTATDSKGRKVRGRFYPPAASASQPSGSLYTTSGTQTYAGYWGKLLQAINAAGAEIAVASSTSAGLVAVSAVSVDNRVDTQRRRMNQVVSSRSTLVSIAP